MTGRHRATSSTLDRARLVAGRHVSPAGGPLHPAELAGMPAPAMHRTASLPPSSPGPVMNSHQAGYVEPTFDPFHGGSVPL